MVKGVEWAAGFFEGEGCIYCWKNRQYRYLRLCVSQKEREPLDELVQILGGRVNGPYDNKGAKYEWYANNKEAERIVELLEPYLSSRRLNQLAKAREQIDKDKS